MVFFRTILFQISDCLSAPTFCHFVDYLGCYWRICLPKTSHESTLWVRMVVQQDKFYPHAFVDIAAAGRRRGIVTTDMKHDLFHQSTLGRDVKVQNMHNLLFKSPRVVIKFTVLIA